VAKAGVDPAELAYVTQLVEDEGLDSAVTRVTDAMLSLGIVGTSEEIVQRCKGLVAMGAKHLSFGPPLGPSPLEAIDILGRQVLPHLR